MNRQGHENIDRGENQADATPVHEAEQPVNQRPKNGGGKTRNKRDVSNRAPRITAVDCRQGGKACFILYHPGAQLDDQHGDNEGSHGMDQRGGYCAGQQRNGKNPENETVAPALGAGDFRSENGKGIIERSITDGHGNAYQQRQRLDAAPRAGHLAIRQMTGPVGPSIVIQPPAPYRRRDAETRAIGPGLH